jgi:hypothetical protein
MVIHTKNDELTPHINSAPHPALTHMNNFMMNQSVTAFLKGVPHRADGAIYIAASICCLILLLINSIESTSNLLNVPKANSQQHFWIFIWTIWPIYLLILHAHKCWKPPPNYIREPLRLIMDLTAYFGGVIFFFLDNWKLI